MASKQTQKTQQQQQQQQAQLSKQKAAEEAEKIKEYIAKQVLCFASRITARSEFRSFIHFFSSIHYSDRYTDDEYEYRHVILPKPLFKMIPKSYFNADDPGVLRLLSEAEWRGIGITQSLGWEHYEVHGISLATLPLLYRLSDCATTSIP
jgi:cyclin-dependent kinase regulatory subunit CKS1